MALVRDLFVFEYTFFFVSLYLSFSLSLTLLLSVHKLNTVYCKEEFVASVTYVADYGDVFEHDVTI